ATSRAIVWLSTASPVFAVRVVISAPPPPLCAPPAPYPCCRVPTAPALRGARYAVTRPPPRPAPLRSAGASCPPARRTGRGHPAHPAPRAGRAPAATPPVPLRPPPAPRGAPAPSRRPRP